MKRTLFVLAGILLVGAASVLFGAVAMTSHSGHPPNTVVLGGSGYGTTYPSTAYWTGFEEVTPGLVLGRSGTSAARFLPDQLFGTKATNGFWRDQADSLNAVDGATYSRAYVSGGAARFNGNGLEISANQTQSDSLCSLVQLDLAANNAGVESFYLDFWFRATAADTTILGTGVGANTLSKFCLATIVGQNSANTYDLFRVEAANDSLRGHTSARYYGQDLASASNDRLNDIINGQWHRVAVFLESESNQAGNTKDGKMKVWVDGAMADSSAAVDWPNATSGWYAVKLLPVLTEDPARNWVFDFDSIYAAAGHATTVDASAAARVCLGNKITFGNCTKLIVQPVTAWSNTAITFPVRGDFAATDKAYVFVTTTTQLGGISTDKAVDSLKVVIPPLTAGADSVAYMGQSKTWKVIDAADNGGLLLWNSGGYDAPNQTHRGTTIEWGDGAITKVGPSAADTTSTHTYKTAGTYRLITRILSDAGEGMNATNMNVHFAMPALERYLYRFVTGATYYGIRDNREGENRVTFQATTTGPIRIKLKRFGQWEAAANYLSVTTGGVTVKGGIDSLKIISIPAADTLQVIVH